MLLYFLSAKSEEKLYRKNHGDRTRTELGYHTSLSPKLIIYHSCQIITLCYHNSSMAFDRSLIAGKFLSSDSMANHVSSKQIFSKETKTILNWKFRIMKVKYRLFPCPLEKWMKADPSINWGFSHSYTRIRFCTWNLRLGTHREMSPACIDDLLQLSSGIETGLFKCPSMFSSRGLVQIQNSGLV